MSNTKSTTRSATLDLFADVEPQIQSIGASAFVLRRFAVGQVAELLTEVERIAVVAPFRHMITPGGLKMQVAMTNCGTLGWVSDRKGYRYESLDPNSNLPWPQMPFVFSNLARQAAAAAGFEAFKPDACLINQYNPATRLSLHQDKDEEDFTAPIVSVSLGLPAIFMFGGLQRSVRPIRVPLQHGDVVVWGGESRLVFHGVAPLAAGEHPLLGKRRINLTFRKAH